MKNPYVLNTKDTVQIRVSKKLLKVIDDENKRLQRIADMKHGKGKFKVKRSFASHKLAEVLR